MSAWLLIVAMASAGPQTFTARTARVELPARAGAEVLPIRVSWPDGATASPVIVFSHGMGGSRDAYEAIVRPWVEHGYVVIQPTHGDSIVHKTREELKDYDSREAFAKDPANASTWRARPEEVTRVLDQLDWIVGAVDGLDAEDLDRERIGVGGHSFGAHTSMLVGGATLHPPGLGAVQLTDPRADAILLISPQGTGLAMHADSYATITPPTLMITGSEDASSRTGRGVEWRMEAWEGLPTDNAWLLFIEGADHSFGGIGGRPGAEKRADQVGWVHGTALQFWDAHLRDDAGAAAWLDSDGITTDAGADARLERKKPAPE